MTFEEVHNKHNEDLKWVNELYTLGKINALEMSAIKEQIDHEYIKNLNSAR